MNADIDVKIRETAPVDEVCDALILFLPEKAEPQDVFRDVDRKLKNQLSRLLKEEHFRARPGESLVYHTNGALPAARIIVTGIGEPGKWNAELFRRASAAATLAARNAACASVAYSMPHVVESSTREDLLQAMAEGALLSTYRFLKFKTKEEEIQPKKRIRSITFLTASDTSGLAAIDKAKLYADATAFARDLVNEPANELNPEVLSRIARKVAEESGLEFRVIEAAELKKLGAGAILGVGSGSKIPPRLIQLTYRSGKKKAKKTALVGKGITFDSGGLSLKPSKSMETMKCDMAGAAAVLCAMRSIPILHPDQDVIGILCAAENMPSGSAIRPGDVLRAMNGKSIEIINTDAEGRLVLADGLSWAVKEGATEIIDLATLTGACVIGLGPYVAGIMSNNQDLTNRIMEASKRTGERFWELPIPDEYDYMVKSDIADMKNLAPSSEAGAIQGALFLREFIGDAKWAHLDIAGPAWYDKDFFYIPKNGSGFGVRTLLEMFAGKPLRSGGH
jgi:leucyl aminopeptidase